MLVEARSLSKSFETGAGLRLFGKGRAIRAVSNVDLTLQARRGGGADRRIGLGQEHDRAARARPACADAGSIVFDGARSRRRRRG
jgi:hypothetical protein